jgi:hypothetical protein
MVEEHDVFWCVYLIYNEMWKVEWFEVLQSGLLIEMVGLHFL